MYKQEEQLKIEVGLRETLIKAPEKREAKSIVQNPFTRGEYVSPIVVQAINLREAYAEKMRAALSRWEPAIRDFYDLYYAYARLNFDFSTEDFLHLVHQKLSVPGNGPINVSTERKQQLVKQAKTQLQTVLRQSDFSGFDINRSFRIVSETAKHLGSM